MWHLEALGLVRAFDDLELPAAQFGHGPAQFVARIAAVGEDMAQPGAEGAYGGKDIDGPLAPSRS